MNRRAAVVKVQIAKRDLGLDDDIYRAMLLRLTGETSSTACSDQQLGVVLDELKAKGWTPKVVAGGKAAAPARPRRAAPADHPAAKKARALWLSLWNLGEVRDPSEAALEAFAHRQLGVERLQWADQALTYKLIEALKAMAERAGWRQDTSGWTRGTDLVKVLKIALIRAQLARLDQVLAVAPSMRWDHAELDRTITGLGADIRAAIEAAG